MQILTPFSGYTRPILLAFGCRGVLESKIHEVRPELLERGLAAVVVLVAEVTAAPEAGTEVHTMELANILAELHDGPAGRPELLEALSDFEGFKKRHSRGVYRIIYD